jgi:hypothetical protein
MGGDRSVGHLLLNDVFYYTTLGGKKWGYPITSFVYEKGRFFHIVDV